MNEEVYLLHLFPPPFNISNSLSIAIAIAISILGASPHCTPISGPPFPIWRWSVGVLGASERASKQGLIIEQRREAALQASCVRVVVETIIGVRDLGTASL